MGIKNKEEYTITCDICGKVENIDATDKYVVSDSSKIHIEELCINNEKSDPRIHLSYGIKYMDAVMLYRKPIHAHEFWMCKECTNKLLKFIDIMKGDNNNAIN